MTDLSARTERLGFRVDKYTKELIERAAHLERRKLTDYCLAALTKAARHTIAEHETLTLSNNDRKAFFNALIDLPEPAKQLKLVATKRESKMTETKLLTERELGVIEGKVEAGQITKEDVNRLLYYIDELHGLLDEGDQDDAFGTEGWRHRIRSE